MHFSVTPPPVEKPAPASVSLPKVVIEEKQGTGKAAKMGTYEELHRPCKGWLPKSCSNQKIWLFIIKTNQHLLRTFCTF